MTNCVCVCVCVCAALMCLCADNLITSEAALVFSALSSNQTDSVEKKNLLRAEKPRVLQLHSDQRSAQVFSLRRFIVVFTFCHLSQSSFLCVSA